ncbi:TadE/TadG family type IV pilus assembly protein [Marivita sp.]|jgi:hypothetical protein|uniref:TadE/TadG family type IV pilus assembly protein n=3 Tax=Marivita sp. TaxID=2003365 RepID=UPI00321AF191
MLRKFFKSQDGSTAVYFALIAPVLIGFAGLGSEASLWLVTERKLQHISDLAAYSGATRALSTGNETVIEASVQARAASSGLQAGDTMVINIPPTTGPNTGRSGFVEVIIERSVDRYLTSIFTNDTTPLVISTRAVAGAIEGSGEPVCMLALSPTASPAFSVGGSGVVDVVGCGFASNSAADDSFDMIGAKVTVTGSCLYAVGGISFTDGLTLTDCDQPQALQKPAPDPYADLPMLASTDVGGLTRLDDRAIDESFSPTEYLIDYPGMPTALFDGGLTLQGDVTLGTGLYIVDGGTLKINANSVITGVGVSFYLMNGAKLDVAGGAELDVQAYDPANPSTRPDPFAGILFFADRTGSSVSHSLSGNSDSDTNGVVYFPNDQLTYTGNSGSSYPCIKVIASQLEVTGSGTVTIGCDPSLPTGAPSFESALRVKLVE